MSQTPPQQPAPESGGVGLPVGTFLGEFELTSVLGEGGFGIVYLAWDHSLERRVALKEYMPSSLATRSSATQVQVKSERYRETFEAGMKSFINEAKLLAQFDHPSLVKVYRFWEANGTAYMVMPYYEGITLKDRLKQMGSPPDEAWLMGLLAPLTEALAVIHAESCFHRDIAPDNVILLAGTGKPLLLDFGAARRVIGDMTQALTVILKPGYAPVEQYAEAPGMKQGAWTDVYALAASVYFAMLGKTPPPSVSRLMQDSYVPLATTCADRYSARFLNAIDKALRVRPEERTASIDELRADLGLAVHDSPAQQTRLIAESAAPAPGAQPRDPGPSTTARRSGGPGLWLGLGAAILVAAAGLGYMLTQRPQQASGGAPATATTVAAPLAAAPQAASRAEPSPEPAPAAPAPAVAPAGFNPASEFDKLIASQTAGFSVEAAPAKPSFRIDKDHLEFHVKSARDGYVTVLVLGPDGSLIRLLPNSKFPSARIKAGVRLQLPSPEVGQIGVGEPAGPEHFLVMVSEQARDYAQLTTRSEGGYLTFPDGAEIQQKLARQPASALPALLGQAKTCPDSRCNDFGAARFTIDVVR